MNPTASAIFNERIRQEENAHKYDSHSQHMTHRSHRGVGIAIAAPNSNEDNNNGADGTHEHPDCPDQGDDVHHLCTRSSYSHAFATFSAREGTRAGENSAGKKLDQQLG